VQLQYLRQCSATPGAPLGELTALPQTSGFGGRGREREREGKERVRGKKGKKGNEGKNGEKEKGTKGRKGGRRERGKGEGKGRNFVQLRFFLRKNPATFLKCSSRPHLIDSTVRSAY